jgi:hypothetical protein
VEIPDDKAPPRSGQGRQVDIQKRKGIEGWAMSMAWQHYHVMGYTLEDTSKTCSFDYVARRNGEERRLEVKGLAGGIGSVLVTAGEVQSAKDASIRTDLVVIHDIQLIERSPGVFQGQGGTVYVIENWFPDDDRLKPVQYEYLI